MISIGCCFELPIGPMSADQQKNWHPAMSKVLPAEGRFYYEKVGELGVWGISLSPIYEQLQVFKFF
jgi:hypothetical protein